MITATTTVVSTCDGCQKERHEVKGGTVEEAVKALEGKGWWIGANRSAAVCPACSQVHRKIEAMRTEAEEHHKHGHKGNKDAK